MKKISFIFIATLFMMVSCKEKSKQQPVPDLQQPQQVLVVQATGEVLPENGLQSLLSENAGTIKKIYVKAGQHVKKGEPLLLLDNSNQSLTVQDIRLKIATQQAHIEVAKAQSGQTSQNIENKSKELEISKRLYAKGAETKENLTNLENDITIQKHLLNQNEQNVIANQRQLQELKNQLKMNEKSLTDMTLKAPADGIVMDVKVEQGDVLAGFTQYATFAPDGPIVVEAEVDELFANYIELGQTATINIIGYPNVVATGKVVWAVNYLSKKSIFSGSNDEKEDRRVRKIKIKLDSSNKLLLGTKVNCIIKTAK